MFAKHTLQVRIVKVETPAPSYGHPTNKNDVTVEKVGTLIQETVSHAALTFTALYAAKTLLDLTKEVALIAAVSKAN